MANDNKSKDKGFFDFSFWFNENKDMILGHDNLNAVEQYNLKREVQFGKNLANIEKGLRRINNIYAKIGLTPEAIPLRNNEGYTLVYKPLDADKYGLRDDQWPSITIENSEDGVTIHNGMWASEGLSFIRGQNGEVGITSSISKGINQAADVLESKINSLLSKKALDPKGVYREIKKITGGNINSFKNLSATVYSPNQLKDYNKMDQKNVRRKRFESTQAMKTQVEYASYIHDVYKAVGQIAKGLPTEKQFTRWFDDILTFARGAESIKEIEDFVRGNFSWIYNNAWRKELENFYDIIVKKVKQGTMTEGTVGKLMFGEPDVIASNYQKAGKKIAQNAQLYEQFNHYQQKLKGIRQAPTVARGRNIAFTKNTLKQYQNQIKQGKIDEDSIYKDLYDVAYLSEEAIYNAYKEIIEAQSTKKFSDNYKKVFGNKKLSSDQLKKIQLAALKGFGNDAILVSEGLADEMNELRESKRQNDIGISQKDADAYVRNILIKQHEGWLKAREKNKKAKGYKERAKELEELRGGKELYTIDSAGNFQYNYKGAKRLLEKFLSKEYDLDGMTDILKFGLEDGKFVDVITSRKMYSQNGVARAGVTGDMRAVWQKTADSLMALTMLNMGYDESDVFVSPTAKVKDKELRPAIFKDMTQMYSDKNSRTTFMERFSKLISYIDQNRNVIEAKVKTMKDSEGNLYKDLQDYLNKDKILGQYIILNKDGSAAFDQVKFAKDYDSRIKKGKRGNTKYNIYNSIEDIIRIGQELGLYNSNKEYFTKVGGGKYFAETNPTLGMSEFGRSSTDEYGSLGDNTHSGFKIDWKVFSSMKGTEGAYKKYITDNLDKYILKDKQGKPTETRGEAFRRLVAPIENSNKKIEEQLQEKAKDYDYYIKNAEYLKQTYTRDLIQLQKDMTGKEDVFLLEMNELQSLGLLTDVMDYGEKGSPGGEELGVEAFRPLAHVWSNATEEELAQAKKEGKLILDINNKKDILRAIPKGTRTSIMADMVRKLEYGRLRALHGRDLLRDKYHIKGYKDIQVGASIGDDRLIANIDGEDKAAALFFMGLGDYVPGRAKKGYYMPDETAKYTDNFFSALLNAWDPTEINKAAARRRAAYQLNNYLKNVEEEYREGSVYENTHTLTKKDLKESGYLRLMALSGHSDEILQDLLGNKGVKDVTRVMNFDDFIAMAKAKSKTKEGKQELLNLYETTTGSKWTRNGRNNFLTDLANLFNINAKGYKGYTFDNGAILRNPTIRFRDDVMGGKAVLTSNANLVSPGSMAINKYSAEIQKGDMDGDMVAFMYAFAAGDMVGAQKAFNDYYIKLRDEQKNVDELSSKMKSAEKTREKIAKELNIDLSNVNQFFRFGEISDINAPINSYQKGKTVASMWFNKKGAGIFGNAAFIAEKLLEKASISPGDLNSGSSSQKALGFSGTIISGMHQTLYQEGISAKKSGAEALELAATVQTMASQAQTWNDEDTLRRFIGYLEDLGIVGKNGKNFFKDNTLQKLGLPDLSKDKETLAKIRQAYADHAESVKKRFGSNSKELKDINKQIKKIDKIIQGDNEELNDLTKESFIATIKMLNHEFSFGDGKSWGDSIESGYYELNNHLISNLTRTTGDTATDEITLKAIGEDKKAQGGSSAIYQSRIQQINTSKLLDIPAARVTTRAGRVIINNKGGVPDAWFLLAEKAKEYAELTSDEQRQKYLKERKRKYASMLNENEKVLKAVTLGTVSHKMAELIQEKGLKADFITTEKEALEFFNQIDSTGLLDNYKSQMQYLLPNMTDEEIEEALSSSLYKGAKNIEYVRGKILEAQENGGGGVIGTEIPLVAFTNPENGAVARGRGTSDIMYYTLEKYLDEEGKEHVGTRIKIGDYKNTSHGQLELTNALQGLAYRQFVLDFINDIHHKQEHQGLAGEALFDAYLGFGSKDPRKPKDNFVDSLYWRMDEYAKEESNYADKDSKEYRDAYEKARKKLTDLYEIAKGDVRGVDLEFYSHGANGIINEYSINSNDTELNKLFAEMQKTFFKDAESIPKYDYSKKGYKPSKEVSLIESGGAAERIASIFGGTNKQAEELFGKDYKYLKSLYEGKESREEKLLRLKYQRTSLERQLPTTENLQKIEELKKQEEELVAQIGNQEEFDKLKELEEELLALKGIDKSKLSETQNLEYTERQIAIEQQIKDILSSDYYKIRSQQEEMGKKSFGENVNGADYARKYIEQRESIANFNKGVYEQNLKASTAREDLESLNKDFEKYAKAAAEAKAESESRLLDEKGKELAEAKAKELAAVRDLIVKNIMDTFIDTAREDEKGYIEKDGKKYSLVGPNGRTLSQAEAEKLGLYSSNYQQTQQQYYDEAKKSVERSDHSKIQTFETRVLAYYEDQFKLQNQINKYQEQLAKAREEGNEIEENRLEKEIERVEKIKKLTGESEKANFWAMGGANQKSHDDMKALAEAKNLKEQQDQKKIERQARLSRASGGQGGAGGASLFGINAGVARWISRLMNGGMLYRFIGMIRRGIRSLTQEAKQLDQAMISLRIVTEKNMGDARTLINQYAKLGKQLGATAVEITNISSQWLRQGYDISQVNDLITSSMYLSKLGMIDANEAVKDLTSSMKGFKLEASQAMDVVDKLTALDVKAATTAGEIAQGLSQFASLAGLNGVSVDQAAAYVATIADVSQQSGTTVGQALKGLGLCGDNT